IFYPDCKIKELLAVNQRFYEPDVCHRKRCNIGGFEISELTLPDDTETEDVTIYIKNKQEKHLISNNEDLLRYF
ncbi:11367_t:CDS:2, partial [Entrophospora sp. SA101]